MSTRFPRLPQSSQDVSFSNNEATVTGLLGAPIQDVDVNTSGVLYIDPSQLRWSIQEPFGDVKGPFPFLTVQGITGIPFDVNSAAPLRGQVPSYSDTNASLSWVDTNAIMGSAGGDLSGTYPNPTVVKIQNIDVNSATPVNDQAFIYSTANNKWNPQDRLSYLYALSGEKTAGASNNWHQLSGNSITLTPGTWEVSAAGFWGNNGSIPDYAILSIIISTNNGADSSSIPTAVSTTGNVTLKAGITSIEGLSGSNNYSAATITTGTFNRFSYTMPPVLIAVSANTSIFVVTYSTQTTSNRTRIFANILARKISTLTS